MSNPAPICTHIKTNGIRCGSPAASGTGFCHHHSAIKTATSHSAPKGRPGSGEFAPIPFIFPEDRASMQINFFLLLQAFNQHQIDLRTFQSMMVMLKAMAKNLGKTGSLVEEPSDERSAAGEEAGSSRPTSQKRDVGHPRPGNGEREDMEQGAASDGLFEFSPELMAKMEEIERLSPNDPSRAERICAAVAEGANELREQGLGLIEISPVAG